MPFTWGLNPMQMQMQLLQQQRLANGQMNPQMVQPSFSTVMSQLPAPTNPILLPLLPATSGPGSNSLQQLQLPRRVGISVSQQPQRKFTIGGPTEAVDVLTCKVKLEGETSHLREVGAGVWNATFPFRLTPGTSTVTRTRRRVHVGAVVAVHFLSYSLPLQLLRLCSPYT